MDKNKEINNLVYVSSKLVLQLQELLYSKEFEYETEQLIEHNITLIDAMTKTAFSLQNEYKVNEEFIKLYSDIIENNYNFCKKLLGY